MSIFSFNINNSKIKKENCKLSFFVKKHNISFLAYDLLKKFVVKKIVSPEKLDFAHPKNWNPKVLKSISPKAMQTLYRLSDIYNKNSQGMISQKPIMTNNNKKLSPKAEKLLKKIENNQERYDHIDLLIKKYKINKAFKN